MLIRESFVAGVPKPFHVVENYIRVKRATGVVGESIDIDPFHNGQRPRIDLNAWMRGTALMRRLVSTTWLSRCSFAAWH